MRKTVHEMCETMSLTEILGDMIEYLTESPGRSRHHAQLVNDLTIAYNNWVEAHNLDDDEDY